MCPDTYADDQENLDCWSTPGFEHGPSVTSNVLNDSNPYLDDVCSEMSYVSMKMQVGSTQVGRTQVECK